MKRLLLVLLIPLVMASKCKEDDPRVVAFEAGQTKVNVDKRVLYECPELLKLKGRSEEEVMTFVKEITDKYQACRAWKAELNKIVKDAFNVEAP
jgi:hypothetical protein